MYQPASLLFTWLMSSRHSVGSGWDTFQDNRIIIKYLTITLMFTLIILTSSSITLTQYSLIDVHLDSVIASDNVFIHRQDCLRLNSHPRHLEQKQIRVWEFFYNLKRVCLHLVSLALGDVALQGSIPTHWNSSKSIKVQNTCWLENTWHWSVDYWGKKLGFSAWTRKISKWINIKIKIKMN